MSVPSTLFPVPLKGMDEYLLEAPQGELEDEAEYGFAQASVSYAR